MSTHVAWTDIESLYHVRKLVDRYPHLLKGNNVVRYRAKVKLHGTNAGVRLDLGGKVTAFSRTSVITPQSDNAGFAKWVTDREQHFAKACPVADSLIIYGEWCGPGIQKGVAVSQLKEKTFAAFAARYVVDPSQSDLIIDSKFDYVNRPETLRNLLKEVPDCHVIPWFNDGEEFEIDWASTAESLQPVIDRINAHVMAVEACDPWAASTFGIRGTGEGLVFYPVSEEHQGYECFSNLCFKAKGKKHQVVAHTKPAQADPTIAAGAKEFADMVVTPARLEQGIRAVNEGELVFDVKKMGDFLRWINNDIEKETTTELEAAGLDKKVAHRACGDKARLWFIAEVKKL